MLVNAIWDFDGTLFDTYPEMMVALAATLNAHGDAEATPENLLTATKRTSIRKVFAERAPKLNTTVAALNADYLRREAQTVETAKPYPEAPAVLQAIVDAGGNNLLMTHRDNSAWGLLQAAGLRDLFLGGVTANLHLARKPAPDAINYLLERHQLNPARTAMIGDRALDVDAGIAAGVATIYFNVDGLNAAPQATYQVNALSDIKPLFTAR